MPLKCVDFLVSSYTFIGNILIRRLFILRRVSRHVLLLSSEEKI